MSAWLLLIVPPIALTVGSLVGAWRAGLSRREDLGLKLPSLRAAAVAAGLFLLLAIGSELLYRHWQLDAGTGGWSARYGPAALAVRVAFAALLYPIAEELFFRGFLFGAIRRKRGELVAILGSSALFAAMHLQYDWRGMLLVLIDALFFGAVRSRTGSVLLTMALHVAGNSFAVWQRL